MKARYFTLLLGVGVVCTSVLILSAGINKMYGLHAWALELHRHEILPQRSVDLVAVLVGALEVLVGCGTLGCVCVGRPTRLTAAAGLLSLFSAFTTYLAFVAWVRGGHEGCSCGSLIDGSAKVGIARNVLFMAVVVLWVKFPASRSAGRLDHAADS